MNLRHLAAAALLASPALSDPAARAISYEIVPAPDADAELSPDGRWAARAIALKGRPRLARITFTDRRTRRTWSIQVSTQTDWGGLNLSHTPARLWWSPDSRACAIQSGSWRVAYPLARRLKLISRVSNDDFPAWAPRSQRLALLGQWGAPLRLWNGRRLSGGRSWIPSDYPEPGDAHIWQADWSPDESAILLRFYGHAERGPEQGGHTFVISPRTGRALYGWGDEARPAAWLDSQRVIYIADHEGLGGAGDLIVARPGSRLASQRHGLWLQDVVAWALSPRNKTIWALKSNGDLLRSPSRFKRWRLVRRLPKNAMGGYQAELTASPHGDLLSVTQGYDGHRITFVSTGPRPWVASWDGPIGDVSWRPGRSLPMLSWEAGEGSPAHAIQLKW